MVNKRVNPIVAERDDMIGRSIPDSRGDKPASGGAVFKWSFCQLLTPGYQYCGSL